MTQSDWKEAGVAIWDEYKVAHPSWDEERQKWSFKLCTRGVLKYFDFYDFGFRNAAASWNGHTDNVAHLLVARLGDLRQRLGAFLRVRAPYERLLKEIDAHCADDVPLRRGLHGWFLDLALAAKYAWWKEFAIESDKKWKTLEGYMGWVATGNDKLGELFGAHFGDPNEVLKYNEVLEESVNEFENLFRKLKEYDKRFLGKTIKRRFGAGMSIEADFARNVFVVKDAAGTVDVGPVRFLVWVDETTTQEKVAVPRRKSRAMRTRFRSVTKTTTMGRAHVPEVPFKAIHTWPAWMAAFGDTLALVIALKNVAEDWRTKDKLEVVGKMSMNTFQAIGSVSSALYFTFRTGRTVPGLLRFAGGAGQVIEAYYNVKEGLILMFDEEESGVVRALARGDEVEAIAQMAKGWVLVSSVVPGVVGFGGAFVSAAAGGAGAGAVVVGGAAAMTPLAIGLGVGALVVLGVEIFLYQHRGPDDAMAPVEDRLKGAIKAEIGDVDRYRISRTVDAIEAFTNEAGRVFALAEA